MKKTWVEILIILFLGLTPLLWYKPGTLALGHDMGFPLAPIDHFSDRLYMWTQRVGGFGSDQSDSTSGFFIHGLEALLSKSGLFLVVTQQISFIFWFIAPALGMYFLLSVLFPEESQRVVRLAGTVLYMFNHFFLQAWFIAERPKFSLATALPVVLGLVIIGMRRVRPVWQIALGIGMTLFIFNAGPGIPLYAGMLLAVGIVGLWQIRNRTDLWLAIRLALGSLLATLVLGAYWIGPLAYYSYQSFASRVDEAGGAQGAINWSREISKNASIANLLRLQGIPDWYDNPGHPYANQFLNNPGLIILSIIFPLLAFSAVYLARHQSKPEQQMVFMWVVLTLVAIVFTSGSHYPFGIVYDWLLGHIPGFPALRTPFYKFGMIVWLGYAVLIAISVQQLWYKLAEYRFWRWVLLVLSVIAIGVYNYPYFTGVFFYWSKNYSTMLKVPEYIFDFKKWLDDRPQTAGRVLLIPNLDPGNRYEQYNWGYFSLSTIPTILSRRAVVSNDKYLSSSEDKLLAQIYDDLTTQGDSKFLSYLGIDTLVLRRDFVEIPTGSYQPGLIKKAIENSSNFHLTKKMGEWEIYQPRNNLALPMINTTSVNGFIDAKIDDLGLLGQASGVDLGQSFVLSKDLGTKNPLDLLQAVNILISPQCANCADPWQVSTAYSPVPKILPGSRLFFLVELREKWTREKIKNSSQQLDFELGTLSKRVASIDALMARSDRQEIIAGVMRDMQQILQQVLGLQNKLPSQTYRQRVKPYLFYLRERLGNWKRANYPIDKEALLDVEWSQERLSDMVFSSKDTLPDPYYRFRFGVPTEGDYELKLYNYPKTEKPSQIKLDDNPLSFTFETAVVGWQNLGTFALKAGGHEIALSRLSDGIITGVPQELALITDPQQTTCKAVDFVHTPERSQYELRFNYQTLAAGGKLQVRLSFDPQDRQANQRPKYFINDLLEQDALPDIYTVKFRADKYTKIVHMEFCAEGGKNIGAQTNISELGVTYKILPALALYRRDPPPRQFKDPIVKFRPVNQTKYVVRMEGVEQPTWLNFNQRFDSRWKLKKISLTNLDNIFPADSLVGTQAGIQQYAAWNQHFVKLDLQYLSPKITPAHFSSNGFANSWLISPDTETQEFLLEYEPQQVFYKASLISLIGLVAIAGICLKRYILS